MKVRLLVEIESVQALGKEDVAKVEGMTEEEALTFLVDDIKNIESQVRKDLMLPENDSVRVKLKLEDAE